MVDRIILYIELVDPQHGGKSSRADQRRKSGVESGPRLSADWQQLAVAPQVARSRLDGLARESLPHDRVVVHDFERSEALTTDPQRLCRIRSAAQVTLQAEQGGVLL